MGENTAIGWCDDTVNFWWGCTKIDPTCRDCYAETWSQRHIKRMSGHDTVWGKDASRWIRVDAAIKDLRRIARKAKKSGKPRFVFIQSMSDIFEDRPDLIESRLKAWTVLKEVCADGWVIPLILTKRPEIMLAWAREHGWPRGAWAGVTAGTQASADERLPILRQVSELVGRELLPITFASCEGLLERVVLGQHLAGEHGLKWVIVGGESGSPKARPMLPEWARSARDECGAGDAFFFFKQWGTWGSFGQVRAMDLPGGAPAETKEMPTASSYTILARWRSGKKATGDHLDGVQHKGRPPAPTPPASPPAPSQSA